MPQIRVLSEAVANRIAAGEVVERPASIVKELLENALDSGARRVSVAIETGGKKLIRIEDDGCGIAAEEVATAFERHATSKLREAADLDRIATLGFRGEALPSIASVARVTLTTQAAGIDAGTRIDIQGGKVLSLETVTFAKGTTVEVRELFAAVPARRKFLKATAGETAACTQAVLRAALAHPAVHFTFASNGRQRFACPAAKTERERVGQLFGGERAERLLELERTGGPVRLKLLADHPEHHHGNRTEQYMFLNQRPFLDSSLQHAIRRGYEGLVPGGRFPSVFLYLDVDPTAVDVNVHPAKTEVRFADPRAVQSMVAGAVREALARAAYVPALKAAAFGDGAEAGVHEPVESFARAKGQPVKTYRIPGVPSGPQGSVPAASFGGRSGPLPGSARGRGGGGAPSVPAGAEEERPRAEAHCAGEALPAEAGLPVEGGLRVIGQLRQTFIVAVDETGLVLADQHTAHERILYEQLQRTRGDAPVQPLLLPQLVEVPAARSAELEDAAADLAVMGVELEPMGGAAFAVRSLPAGMAASDASRLVLDCLEALVDGRTTKLDERRHKLLSTVACHAAVKTNMSLEHSKMEWILRELMKCQDPYQCPHGRATLLRMDEGQIRNSFKRYW